MTTENRRALMVTLFWAGVCIVAAVIGLLSGCDSDTGKPFGDPLVDTGVATDSDSETPPIDTNPERQPGHCDTADPCWYREPLMSDCVPVPRGHGVSNGDSPCAPGTCNLKTKEVQPPAYCDGQGRCEIPSTRQCLGMCNTTGTCEGGTT